MLGLAGEGPGVTIPGMKTLFAMLAAALCVLPACGVEIVDEVSGAVLESLPQGCEPDDGTGVQCADGLPAWCADEVVPGCEVIRVGAGPFPACCQP